MKMKYIFHLVIIILMIFAVPGFSVANAEVKGEFGGVKWLSDDTINVKMLLLPTDGNVYRVTGVNFHLSVNDENTNKEIVDADIVIDEMNEQIQWSSLKKSPDYINIPLQFPVLNDYSNVEVSVKNISLKYVQVTYW